ncbi:hypothetical protein Tco_0486698 [Tanacetum coccineum]
MASIFGSKIQIFYDHVSFPLKHKIDHAPGVKLHDKSAKESWEIIENLALYEHEKYTKGKSPEKVLVREEIGKPDTKYVNVISLVRIENTFEKHWKEIHMTWAQLAKKQDEDTTLQDVVRL